MLRKLAAPMAAGTLALCLFGCSSVTGVISSATESAQQKVDNLTAFASDDLTSATTLAAKDALNYPAASQCLPVLSAWLTKLKSNADRYKQVRGAASAAIYRHWARQTIKQGFPADVTLACSAMWVTEKGDFADALGVVKSLLGR